jgi:cell division septation protein DedD
MRGKVGLAALCLAVAMPAMARDGALNLGLTAPPTALLEPGMSLGWQETLGRRLVLGAGIGVSEPRPVERELSLTARLALPYDVGFNQQWYPWIGVEQSLPVNRDETDSAQWHAGLGLEHHFLPEIAGFLELRWQPGLTETVHLQLGLRFWPGRLNRLDARMRDSEPVQPGQGSSNASSGPIVLNASSAPVPPAQTDVSSTEVTSAVNSRPPPDTESDVLVMSDAPGGVPMESTDVELPVVSEPSPTPEATDSRLTVNELAEGTYVHLGLFRAKESVQRLQGQLETQAGNEPVRVAFDDVAGGYRVVLGPYTDAVAGTQQARLAAEGFDSFLYRRK